MARTGKTQSEREGIVSALESHGIAVPSGLTLVELKRLEYVEAEKRGIPIPEAGLPDLGKLKNVFGERYL